MAIDEGALTKGQLRKLTALRRSVGDKLGEEVFLKWCCLSRYSGRYFPDYFGRAEAGFLTLF